MNMIYKVSVERCIACGKCELACAFAHGSEGRPSKTRINVVRRAPGGGTPIVCFQCDGAAGGQVCPTAALVRSAATGAIEMVRSRCITCRMCVAACPFGNMLWDETYHCVQKCDLCGGDPRCVPFCPTGAIAWVPASRAAIPPEPLDRNQLVGFSSSVGL
jgi:Fe-S-cluster-containing hydrogenase component 2